MKEAIKKMRAAQEASDRTFEAWEADIENEALEAAHDNAYREYHAAAKELASDITKLTGIDSTTAYRMALHKLGELEALAKRMA